MNQKTCLLKERVTIFDCYFSSVQWSVTRWSPPSFLATKSKAAPYDDLNERINRFLMRWLGAIGRHFTKRASVYIGSTLGILLLGSNMCLVCCGGGGPGSVSWKSSGYALAIF